MKIITLCAECAYYSMKKHECTMGAKDENNPRAKFYGNCPLKDGAPVVRCKDCKSYLEDDGGFCLEMDRSIKPRDFCSYGERREK